MAVNSSQWPSERSVAKKVAGVFELDIQIAILAKLEQITSQNATLKSKISQALKLTTNSSAIDECEPFKENVLNQPLADNNYGSNQQGRQKKSEIEEFMAERRTCLNKNEDKIATFKSKLGEVTSNLGQLTNSIG
ncbi:hypothetical protein PTKIN_Ptkin19aG0015800 [Pterospermum kingtungense]